MQARKAAEAAINTAVQLPPSASEYGSTLGSWMMPPVMVPLLLGLAVIAYAFLRN